jgi:ribosome-binding factor A
VKDPRVQQGDLISITRAEVTGDLRYCKVFVSVLGDFNEKDFKKGLKSAAPWLRREVGRALDLRYTPELIFELDRSIAHGAHINELIGKLDIPKEDDDNADSE